MTSAHHEGGARRVGAAGAGGSSSSNRSSTSSSSSSRGPGRRGGGPRGAPWHAPVSRRRPPGLGGLRSGGPTTRRGGGPRAPLLPPGAAKPLAPVGVGASPTRRPPAAAPDCQARQPRLATWKTRRGQRTSREAGVQFADVRPFVGSAGLQGGREGKKEKKKKKAFFPPC